jgi:drug/metabolite transporter (DMT)-like permease
VLLSQSVGLVLVTTLALAAGEPFPSGSDLLIAMVGGILGSVGIIALYRGLSIGRMGVVAPVTGVLAAIIPVAAGVVLEGLPAPAVMLGIVIAIVAVVLVSRVRDERGGPSGLREALIAGIAIGCFSTVIAQLSDGIALSGLSVIRLTQAVFVSLVIVSTRSAWRVPRSVVPMVLAVGLLDMAGNISYLLAAQAGELAVAAILTSLYPVATVVLAALILRERVTRDHAVGIGLAAVAIALIGYGSA